ncbi:suppressor of fused domain protein [Pseudarthrobacter sp. R1]|uniref:suppressor of fused domain protein n=1 Tax=Pseudarthrobacter sp. R1 TaxID=2944934 RepID=UPI00210EEE5C|nr:suppressor of fused domain protein [Pseudarthrobacter sp. R1]MCQ6270837.1 suppressor of fused domain protein [Pseudarthrobacter sp. R1]
MRHLEELEAHYRSVVGAEPEFGTMTSLEGNTVGIFHWPRASSRMGVSLYASAGISVPGPGGRGHSHTVEVFTGIKQDSEQVREAFANLITSLVCSTTPHPARHGVFVAGDWEVIEGRKFTGWVLTERPDELIPDLQLKDGRHITFLDALPVFAEEAAFRHGNRADDLLGMWEEWEVKSADLDRELHPSLKKPRKTSWLRSALKLKRQ